MLTLRVTFPAGRYLAARPDDPAMPEWPPHPSRLFSAMVAAAYRGGDGCSARRREALEWLEALPPPAIFAPDADLALAPISYVPPGDIVGAKGGAATKQFEHPIHRWRQDRRFPEARILGTPDVEFSWQVDCPSEHLATLEEIARAVTHVGTSHSMAIVVASDDPPRMLPNYLANPLGGTYLRVTRPGRLRELDDVFAQADGVRRPLPQCEVICAYGNAKASADLQSSSRHELLPLQIAGPRYALEDAYALMRAVRAALMGVLGDDAPACLHGHGHSPHVAWLPLADIGHAHASGMILGVGLGLHRSLEGAERQTLLGGLARLNSVRLPDGREIALSVPPPGRNPPRAMVPLTWTHASHDWATVTPVVLDRAPKHPDPTRLERALAQSLVLAGFPEPESVALSSHSHFEGAPKSLAYQVTQPRFHARVRFSEMVAGPVFAGRQRFFGVGVFRPLDVGATA